MMALASLLCSKPYAPPLTCNNVVLCSLVSRTYYALRLVKLCVNELVGSQLFGIPPLASLDDVELLKGDLLPIQGDLVEEWGDSITSTSRW